MDQAKRTLRAAAKTRRKTAHAADPEAGVRLARVFLDLDLLQGTPPGAVIASYWPMGSEIDTLPLMHRLVERGFRLALPVIPETPGPLGFRAWTPQTPMVPHGFGTQAPADAGTALLRPDAVIVPLLAFDRDGGRLGYGQGHYDRTLAALRGCETAGRIWTAGVAFACQTVDRVPMDDHDVPLDRIVTEAGAIVCTPA